METVIEESALRNKSGIFKDRNEAGRHLVGMLKPDFQELPGALVLAIPSGGVPVGLVLSKYLRLDFDLIIARKLQIPGNTEAGFGAIAWGGEPFYNESLLAALRLTQTEIDEQLNKVRTELELRNALFRNEAPFPEVTDKTVILADDGLASGYTMIAAIDAIKKQNPAQVVVAVPTAPRSSVSRVEPHADRIYCPNIKDVRSFAVADAYRAWRDLSREEVIEMLYEETRLTPGNHKS
mgnify:CR=1 FL=1